MWGWGTIPTGLIRTSYMDIKQGAKKKVAKVGHNKVKMAALDPCGCGGEVVWAKVIGQGMRKVCGTCGVIQ